MGSGVKKTLEAEFSLSPLLQNIVFRNEGPKGTASPPMRGGWRNPRSLHFPTLDSRAQTYMVHRPLFLGLLFRSCVFLAGGLVRSW